MSLSPEQLEYAELLLRRAIGDLKAYRVLDADQQISDENVGFHAQQAVEKALKIALVLAGVDFPKTHDLDFLIARVRESGSEPPPALEGLGWLTPWGTNFRYDESVGLDRSTALAAAKTAVAWAESMIQAQRSDPGGEAEQPHH